MNYDLVSYKTGNGTINLRFNTYEDARNAWMDIDRLIVLGKNYMLGILSMTKPTNPRDGFFDFGIEFGNRYDCMLFFARNIRYKNGKLFLQLPDIMIKDANDNIDKVIKDIQFNPKKCAVTILWKDGDVTVSKKGPGDKWDPEKGLMMAFGQHFFGSKTQFNNWRKKVLKEGGMTEEFKQPDIFYAYDTQYMPKHAKTSDNDEDDPDEDIDTLVGEALL